MANRQYFQYALFNIHWTKLAEMEEVDEMVAFFSNEVERVLDRVAPFSTRKRRSKFTFKLSSENLDQMSVRDQMIC